MGKASHFNQAAQLILHGQPHYCQVLPSINVSKTGVTSFTGLSHVQLHRNQPILTSIFTNSISEFPPPPPPARPVCHSGSDLHAVQCGAGAAHTAGPEAALLRQGPVAQGQQLTAQPQVLPAQPRLKATLGVLSEQLAASADVLSSELWEGRRAVSIVPAETQRDRRICLSTHVR